MIDSAMTTIKSSQPTWQNTSSTKNDKLSYISQTASPDMSLKKNRLLTNFMQIMYHINTLEVKPTTRHKQDLKNGEKGDWEKIVSERT